MSARLFTSMLCLSLASAPLAIVPLGSALAQDPSAKESPSRPAVGTASPDAAPAAPSNETTGQPTGNQATVASPAGTLAVATVKMDSGWRASKLIGAPVYNEHNDKIGSVDDLILTPQDKVVVAVISVGGFLGIGSKLVAVPYDQIHMQNGRVSMVGADKNALGALPSFTYSNS